MQKMSLSLLISGLMMCGAAKAETLPLVGTVDVGVRPLSLINDMDDSPLKEKLTSCLAQEAKQSDFSIGHRGAPLQFPEHTRESYLAGAKMGAGVLECDVAFTKDKQLVCRHAQNDLATTTNILLTPLAEKCSTPFTPADPKKGVEAKVECRTSNITLAEFKTLKGKMDGFNPMATTPEEYVQGTPAWRTDLYANNGTLMTHKESIELFKQLGVKMTPELKIPVVDMPFDGYTREDYAAQMIQDYIDAGVAPENVYPQSFALEDVLFWINKYPEFGKQAVFLDEDEHNDKNQSLDYMKDLYAKGVRILAPATWKMLTLKDGKITPSEYAKNAKKAGLELIAWTLDRSGPLANGGGFYYQSIKDVVKKDSDMYQMLDVLTKEVGIKAIFSDWPATVTFYANCMGKK